MASIAITAIEDRTQQIGRELLLRVGDYQRPRSERVQDAVIGLVSGDAAFRTALLRFVDALAGLDFRGSSGPARQLAAEYFSRDFPGVPRWLRLALRAGTSLPAPLFATIARRATGLIASRFIATPGTGLQAALDDLSAGGRFGSFDILGEHVFSDAEADAYVQQYLGLIAQLAARPDVGERTAGDKPRYEVSLKLSALAPVFRSMDPGGVLEQVRPRFDAIATAARHARVGLNIDIEQYEYRDLVWFLLEAFAGEGQRWSDWPDLGIVVQAYLRDAAETAERAIGLGRARGGLHVRLVRGAYWDFETAIAGQYGWPVPVHTTKAATDLEYEALVVRLLEASPTVQLAVASHNLRSHAWAEAVREALGLPDGVVEHQTLFRTAEAISRALAAMGWVDRDYVPVGELVPGMAYLVRRILENSSQVGFLMQSRTSQDPAELLAAPREDEQDAVADGGDAGFRNEPPARLFLKRDRDRFGTALRITREAWGSRYALHIGGQEVAGEPEPVCSPSYPDGPPVAIVDRADEMAAQAAVDVAEQGAALWSVVPQDERAGILRRAADRLAERRDEFAAWVCHEGGKNWEGALADVDEAIDYLRFYPAAAEQLGLDTGFQPLGVVVAISPWNFPIAIPAGMISAGLITGNAVILKPAETTPLIARLLVDLLHEAGVPAEALICLPGSGPVVGPVLTGSPQVDLVVFTGSRRVGTGLAREHAGVLTARGRPKRVIAEMGGKNPILVFADADLDEAVEAIMNSAFGHAGQKCSACSRVLIQAPIYERLRDRLVAAARALPAGRADDPASVINPIIDQHAADRIRAAADVARREGTVLLDLLAESEGHVLRPLIVEIPAGQTQGSRTFRDEIFGPVLALTPFESEGDAVRLANAVDYGLTAGILSRSPARIERLIEDLDAGNLYVNRNITGARVGLEPFGGFKDSGTGPKAGGEEYLRAFVEGMPARVSQLNASGQPGEPVPQIGAWHASVRGRLAVIEGGLWTLGKSSVWREAAEASRIVLDQGRALARRHPTIRVPGQETWLDYRQGRGIGVLLPGADRSPAEVLQLTLAMLLAGNATLLRPPDRSGIWSELSDILKQAALPRECFDLTWADDDAILSRPWDVLVTEGPPEAVSWQFRQVFTTPRKAPGLPWVLDLRESPGPDDPWFVLQFAQPKTVAIRTLRHGADLALL